MYSGEKLYCYHPWQPSMATMHGADTVLCFCLHVHRSNQYKMSVRGAVGGAAAGAAAGVSTGAGIGAILGSVFPIVGTAIGADIGAAIGAGVVGAVGTTIGAAAGGIVGTKHDDLIRNMDTKVVQTGDKSKVCNNVI